MVLFIFFLALHPDYCFSQLYINEFLASNSSIIEDPDFNDDPDWIEIYNAGSARLNLKGYYLTDNISNPDKWQINNDIYVDPDGYVLFWADGMDQDKHTGFKLSASGEEIGLFSPELVLVDTLTFSWQDPDISMGRAAYNLSQWGFYLEPTPGRANITHQYPGIVHSVPVFLPAGGIYDEGLSVDIFNDMGGTTRYTLDGSEPTINSPRFISPVPLAGTTVIRARIFKNDEIPGPVVTSSYFIDEGFGERNLPVISIATDPSNFWDPETGIYVQDFKPDWEVPVNVEMYEIDGSDRASFNERAGIKINGLYSWKLPQKMLGVYFRKKYGSGNLSYPLILNTYRSSYKSFALRASGSDWSYTLFRDILGQEATKRNMDLDISASRPCIVYLNGQYLGIHNIREKIESDYIQKHHSLEEGTFDMVENQDYPEAGDLVQYKEFMDLFSQDLSLQANFDAVAEKMDLENFSDLVITEMAVANTSISHNVMAWKPKDGGKWKWVLMDLDRGFFNPSSNLIRYYLDRDVWPFGDLFENPDYIRYFGHRLADHLYTTFHPRRMAALIDAHQSDIESEMPNHIDRWLGTTSSYGDAMPSLEYWHDEICNVKSFIQSRPAALLKDLEHYGFGGTAILSLSVVPSDASSLTLNGLDIPETDWSGPYLKDVNSEIRVTAKPGYTFIGWKNAVKKEIIPFGSIWKYLDDGSDQGSAWTDTLFDDSSWSSGPAQLGYGDGDESTVIGYGGDTQQRYITSYFRHSFNLSQSDLNAANYMIKLLRDDGAIVYLNGIKIINDNMDCGHVDYQTLAASSVGEQSESEFNTFPVDKAWLKEGINVLAVEVHQVAAFSSDLSFDLEMVAYANSNSPYISTGNSFPFSMTGDLNLTAVFKKSGECVIPELISENTTLSMDCSPYYVQGDVYVLDGALLTVEPGVEIYMLPGSNVFVYGAMKARGSAGQRIVFKMNPQYPDQSWGALNFENTGQVSDLTYVTIEDASRGPVPVRVGAISAFYADLIMDNILMENIYDNPISARYSDVVLTNSRLHSDVSGDLINVKYGIARIENCLFYGTDKVDADAIDLDNVDDGIIKNCRIYDFVGENNDAIDIGEEASNIVIDSILVYNVFDKGVSAGQRSEVTVRNSIFVNCNMGLGVKDSSRVLVDHCIFYSTAFPVKCYEKNPGRAGGNASITNSVLSNSSERSYFADSESVLEISYSLSDNDPIPGNSTNLWANPEFTDPVSGDFTFLAGSPCIMAGYSDGTATDLGVNFQNTEAEPSVMINMIFINSLNTFYPEFLSLYNPSSKAVDISGYQINRGISCMVPQGITIEPGSVAYLTNQAASISWEDITDPVIEWSEGKLSNSGEAIQLLDKHGIVIDFVRYEEEGNWPVGAFSSGEIMRLRNYHSDNHFPENWTTFSIEEQFSKEPTQIVDAGVHMSIYPNPTSDRVYISRSSSAPVHIEIYSIMGVLLDGFDADGEHFSIELSKYKQPVLIIRAGRIMEKVLLLR